MSSRSDLYEMRLTSGLDLHGSFRGPTVGYSPTRLAPSRVCYFFDMVFIFKYDISTLYPGF